MHLFESVIGDGNTISREISSTTRVDGSAFAKLLNVTLIDVALP